MKKISCLFLISLLAACEYKVIDPNPKPVLRDLVAEEVMVSQAVNNFSFKLFKKIEGDPGENSFISPLSVSMALGMALNGANDETAQSILTTIDFTGLEPAQVNGAFRDLTTMLLSMDNKIDIGLANSVWYKIPFTVHADFSSIIRNQYYGHTQALDFEDPDAKDIINKWVEEKTNRRIKNLIGSIDPDEVMFLVNAIYFKGEWTYKFEPTMTRNEPFTTIDGSVKDAKMMLSKGVTMNYYTNDGISSEVQVFDLPYGNGQFSFTIVLPTRHDHFNEIVNTIDAAKLSEWQANSRSVSVELLLPRFKLTWKKELTKTLVELGMKLKGFPRLLENIPPDKIEISRVEHKSFLEVNEEGSEAAAATFIGFRNISSGGPPPKPSRFVIDRPFLFMIREKHTGMILFMGKLVDPGKLTDQ